MAREDELDETLGALRSCDAIGEALRHAGFSVDSPPKDTELETLRACYIDNLRRWNSALIAENESLRKARDEAIGQRDAARGKLNERGHRWFLEAERDQAIAARDEARAACDKLLADQSILERLKSEAQAQLRGLQDRREHERAYLKEAIKQIQAEREFMLATARELSDRGALSLDEFARVALEGWERVNAT